MPTGYRAIDIVPLLEESKMAVRVLDHPRLPAGLRISPGDDRTVSIASPRITKSSGSCGPVPLTVGGKLKRSMFASTTPDRPRVFRNVASCFHGNVLFNVFNGAWYMT